MAAQLISKEQLDFRRKELNKRSGELRKQEDRIRKERAKIEDQLVEEFYVCSHQGCDASAQADSTSDMKELGWNYIYDRLDSGTWGPSDYTWYCPIHFPEAEKEEKGRRRR